MSQRSKGKILLVEDDRDLRTVVRLVLESNGYSIVEAINGQDALQLLTHEDVDAVIADMRMPRLGGDGVTQQIRAEPHTANLPILLLSGLDLDPSELGADAALQKPFDARELVEVVGRLIRPGDRGPGERETV